MKITIYSTTTCPYCKMLKDYLQDKNIPFTEKLVDQSDELKAEMMRESDGYLGVPFTVVQSENGDKKKVVGFDKQLFEQVLAAK